MCIHINEFLNTPKVEFLDDGKRIRLIEDFCYNYKGRIIIAKKDFICDGGSIPAILWLLISSPFTSRYRNTYIIHDWLCAEYRKLPKSQWKEKRQEADDILLYMCKEAKGVIKPHLIYPGVRIGAWWEYYIEY